MKMCYCGNVYLPMTGYFIVHFPQECDFPSNYTFLHVQVAWEALSDNI